MSAPCPLLYQTLTSLPTTRWDYREFCLVRHFILSRWASPAWWRDSRRNTKLCRFLIPQTRAHCRVSSEVLHSLQLVTDFVLQLLTPRPRSRKPRINSSVRTPSRISRRSRRSSLSGRPWSRWRRWTLRRPWTPDWLAPPSRVSHTQTSLHSGPTTR